MRDWNHYCHVSEHNFQSPSLFPRNCFKRTLQLLWIVSSRCLTPKLLRFPFLALRIFHNKLFLTKNLDASILCIPQHSVFLNLRSLFLPFSWEVHIPKDWSKSALLTHFTGASLAQLKSFWLLLFIYGLHLLRILWKKVDQENMWKAVCWMG